MRASGSSWVTGAVTPAARAATTKVAAWPATTTVEPARTPGHVCRPSSPARTSAPTARTTRTTPLAAPCRRPRTVRPARAVAAGDPGGNTADTGPGARSRTPAVRTARTT